MVLSYKLSDDEMEPVAGRVWSSKDLAALGENFSDDFQKKLRVSTVPKTWYRI